MNTEQQIQKIKEIGFKHISTREHKGNKEYLFNNGLNDLVLFENGFFNGGL